MAQVDIQTLEHAGRTAMAWVPDSAETRLRIGTLLGAAVVALSILVAAAGVLLVAL